MSHCRSLVVVAAAFVIGVAAPAAHAESRAWAAAKKLLPAGMHTVIGLNVVTVKTSQLFKDMWPTLLAKDAGTKDGIEKVSKTCGFDFIDKIDSAVIASDADQNGGAIVLALKGATQKDVDICIDKVAKADGKTASITKDGAITKYAGLGDKDVFVRWVGKDVLAVAMHGEDKDLLTKMTAGGIAKDPNLKGALGKLKTDSAVWLAVVRDQDLAELHVKMSMLYGTATLKAGNVSVDLRMVVDSAKAAADAATAAMTQVEQAKKAGGLPPMLSALIASLKVGAAGSELTITASASEKDIGQLISFAALAGH